MPLQSVVPFRKPVLGCHYRARTNERFGHLAKEIEFPVSQRVVHNGIELDRTRRLRYAAFNSLGHPTHSIPGSRPIASSIVSVT